jgi:hypothetical protein
MKIPSSVLYLLQANKRADKAILRGALQGSDRAQNQKSYERLDENIRGISTLFYDSESRDKKVECTSRRGEVCVSYLLNVVLKW